MSAAWVLMLALQAVSPAPVAETAPRSAFFCQVADRSDRRGAEALRPLNVLLAGTDDAVGESEPIETFDPTGLLGSRGFTRFLRNPAAGGYAIVSGETRDPQAALLSLVERDGGPELGAALGLLRDGREPRYLGQCIRYRSANTAADFQSFNASLGRQ
ncbi:MAG TPA: hypothetical protein VEW25_11685 [Allosphingosinicella sp.]|nr:hypothetical protein [Allosphingosinicella sp.]